MCIYFIYKGHVLARGAYFSWWEKVSKVQICSCIICRTSWWSLFGKFQLVFQYISFQIYYRRILDVGGWSKFLYMVILLLTLVIKAFSSFFFYSLTECMSTTPPLFVDRCIVAKIRQMFYYDVRLKGIYYVYWFFFPLCSAQIVAQIVADGVDPKQQTFFFW